MRTPPNRVKMNALTVARLKPASAPYVVWDTKQHGLAIRIRPTGARAWKANAARADPLAAPRRRQRNRAGRCPAACRRGDVGGRKGWRSAADKKAERNRGTFEELAARYLEEHAKRHKKIWRQADRLVRRSLRRYGAS